MWLLMTARGQSLPIARLPAVLGSAPGADVRVPHESVAAEHARLSEGSPGTLRLETLSEEAVTAVGGKRVARALLRDGDELVLGRVRFTLREAGAGAGAAPDPGSPPREAAMAPPAPPARVSSPPAPVAASPLAASPLAASADDEEPEFVQRRKTLQFHGVKARPGLLHADLSQLPGGQRALLGLGLVLLMGGLAYGIAALMGLLG